MVQFRIDSFDNEWQGMCDNYSLHTAAYVVMSRDTRSVIILKQEVELANARSPISSG